MGLLLCDVIRALGVAFGSHVVLLSLPEHCLSNLLDSKKYLMCLLNISIPEPCGERPGNLCLLSTTGAS